MDDSILRDLNGAMLLKNVIEIYFQKGTSSPAEPTPSPMSSLALFLEPPSPLLERTSFVDVPYSCLLLISTVSPCLKIFEQTGHWKSICFYALRSPFWCWYEAKLTILLSISEWNITIITWWGIVWGYFIIAQGHRPSAINKILSGNYSIMY